MRCVLPFGLSAFLMVAGLPALAGSEIPAAAIDENQRLLGAQRASYLLRQLDLTEEQATNAQGLIDTILTDLEGVRELDVDEVRRIWAEIEKARDAGNQERVQELAKLLQQMEDETTSDAEFLANIESQLTDQQKQTLGRARARLERNPSGSVRPIDLIRAARDLGLSEQQQRALVKASMATRQMLGASLKPNPKMKLEMINFLAGEIRTLLTQEQVPKFERRVRASRPDLVDRGLRVRMPQTSSAEAPPGQENQPAGD